jgi:hypothetical protein
MARAESELFVRTNAVAEAERQDEGSFETVPGNCEPQENDSFD